MQNKPKLWGFKMTNNFSREASEFDELYRREDPWGVRNSIQDLARIKKLNQIFRNTRFSYGLDIGCGEGHLTQTLNFVVNKSAIDISEVALTRARIFYPKINFMKADLRDLSKLKSNSFDFISCFESIYYISEERERKKALREMKSKGKDNAVFCFSVVTIGENIHRKYFTYDEAVRFFASEFNIINQFPISLNYPQPTFPQRVKNKIRRVLPDKIRRVLPDEMNVQSYLNDLNSLAPNLAYQNVFICTKKSEVL